LNSLLKSWSSNSCLICGSTKTSSFILASLVLENFPLKYVNSSLSLSLSQVFLSNLTWYAIEANRFLTYPLNQDVPLSSGLVVFLNAVVIFIFCSGSSSLGWPFHIKSSIICLSTLQTGQQCYNF
jgi:hypothetical protein